MLMDQDGLVAIDENRFSDLVISLRSAITNDAYKLDKEKTTYPDLLDLDFVCYSSRQTQKKKMF
jgi:hypothetical protein